jgi:hypothetical protein
MTLEEEKKEKNKINAKRCLFGKSDPEHVHQQYNSMLNEHLKKAEEEWNFDFEREDPTLSESARYKWECVRSKSVPPMYRSSRIHDPKPKRYSKCDLRANEQANVSSATRQTRTANRTYVASPNKRKPRSANMQTGVRCKSKKQRSILELMPAKRMTRNITHVIKKSSEMANEKPDTPTRPNRYNQSVGNTSPERIFGVLTRSTSRVHTRSTARRHIIV